MLSHPTINLNKKAWLIRHNLRRQTFTWAGVDPLIAYIKLSPLVVNVVTPRLIIKIKYFATECTLCYYAACCQLFLQADVTCGVINAKVYPPPPHLSDCLFNEMRANSPGVCRIHLRLAFALYSPIEEHIVDNLSIETSCELKWNSGLIDINQLLKYI